MYPTSLESQVSYLSKLPYVWCKNQLPRLLWAEVINKASLGDNNWLFTLIQYIRVVKLRGN